MLTPISRGLMLIGLMKSLRPDTPTREPARYPATPLIERVANGNIVSLTRETTNMSTATIDTTIAGAVHFFQSSYAAELKDRLRIAAEHGDLDRVVNADGMIEGDVLNGCAQTADSLTRQQYTWRTDREELDEALNDPEIITADTVDFEAIVAEARTLKELTQYDVIEVGSQRDVLIGSVFASDDEDAEIKAHEEFSDDGNRTLRVDISK